MPVPGGVVMKTCEIVLAPVSFKDPQKVKDTRSISTTFIPHVTVVQREGEALWSLEPVDPGKTAGTFLQNRAIYPETEQ